MSDNKKKDLAAGALRALCASEKSVKIPDKTLMPPKSSASIPEKSIIQPENFAEAGAVPGPIPKDSVRLLLDWYGGNARDLPWRRDPSPYKIWISEIMLQQTRVEAVKEYFVRWLEALPDVEALGNVPEELLMKLWEGLGYYNRARNLKKAAGILVEKYGGVLPASYEELLGLPGIGPYTAGAVASIAFHIPAPAVDGNVLRVISRLIESYEDIALPAVKKVIEQKLAEIIPQERPGDFNQAVMELGAMICIPNGAPKCGECPLADLCKARASGTENSLPIKASQKQRRIEEKTILLILREEEYLLHRRERKGLLSGMWELPNAEGRLSEKEAAELAEQMGFKPLSIGPLPKAKHIFTHVEWHMSGYRIEVQPDAGDARPGCPGFETTGPGDASHEAWRCMEPDRPGAVSDAVRPYEKKGKGRGEEEMPPFSKDVRPKEPEWIFAGPALLAKTIAVPKAFQAYLP